MKRTKILVMIPAARIGGAEKMLMIILDALKNAGNNVILAVGSREGGNKKIAQASAYVFGHCRARGSIRPSIHAVLRERPDIVFLNIGYINLAVFIRLAYPRAKIVARIGNTISCELPADGILRFIKIFVWKISCWACAKIIVQSEAMKTDLVSVIKPDKNKIDVILNVIEDDFLQKQSEKNDLTISNYMFCAATLKRQKRIDVLIAAALTVMRKVESIHLVVAGTSRQEIESSGMLEGIDHRFLDRLHFVGFVENILPLIRDSQFCVSSSDYEGSSNFLIEAKAMNKFCLVTDCPGGNRETFREFKKVLFVVPGSADALAVGMQLAIERASCCSGDSSEILDTSLVTMVRDRGVWQSRLLEVFK